MEINVEELEDELQFLDLIEQYELQEINELLSKELKTRLTMENVFKILKVANEHNYACLEETCFQFLDIHAENIEHDKEFFKLNKV